MAPDGRQPCGCPTTGRVLGDPQNGSNAVGVPLKPHQKTAWSCRLFECNCCKLTLTNIGVTTTMPYYVRVVCIACRPPSALCQAIMHTVQPSNQASMQMSPSFFEHLPKWRCSFWFPSYKKKDSKMGSNQKRQAQHGCAASAFSPQRRRHRASSLGDNSSPVRVSLALSECKGNTGLSRTPGGFPGGFCFMASPFSW